MSTRFAATAFATLLLTMMAAPAYAQAAAVGDPVAGKKQFGPCTSCHTVDAGGKDGIGPNLFGVFGSKAGTREAKFAYSPALKASNLTWDDATLDRWITDPGATVKGSKMEYIGMPRKPTRLNIIAYLKTLKK